MFEQTMERVALFVDGANFWHSTKEIIGEVDYTCLIRYASRRPSYVVAARYYTAVTADQRIRGLLTKLAYNGFQIIEKEAVEYDDNVKGNCDVEIAADAMDMWQYADRFIFATGDGDFHYLVRKLQDKGRRVTVISTDKMIAPRLKRCANNFLTLQQILP